MGSDIPSVPATGGSRRFDGERWWAWDGTDWVPVPSWGPPDEVEGSDTAEDHPPLTRFVPRVVDPERTGSSGNAPPSRRTAFGLVLVAMMLILGIVVVVLLTRPTVPDYRVARVLAADLMVRGNRTAEQKNLPTRITAVSCRPSPSSTAFTCTAHLTDSTSFELTAKVASDGASYSTG